MGPVMVCMETHEASPAVRKAWGMPPFPEIHLMYVNTTLKLQTPAVRRHGNETPIFLQK
jgi:hypothetical protein